MSGASRLAFIDWLRGVAVVLMIQTHVYDSWLAPEARGTSFHQWSRVLGGAPAPLFLFLAGVALALAGERRVRASGAPAAVREGIRRGGEVLVYAVLFRVWMFTTGGFTRPADLLRVDVLNCIGLSMIAMAAATLRWRGWGGRLAVATGLWVLAAVLTPLSWDFQWPLFIPGWLLGYVNGRVANSLFPLLPWAAFTAAGAAVGLVLDRTRQQGREAAGVGGLVVLGALAVPLALAMDRWAPALHAPGDFWLTSPSFLLVRVGILLLLTGAAWLWHQAPWAGERSPLRRLGQASLLVYWVHIEIVYGFATRWARRSLDPLQASVGLVVVLAAMWLLAVRRTEGSLARIRGLGAAAGATR